MNIGFISTRLAGVDGVSLETTKVAHTLRDMGHNCFYCAGELEDSEFPSRLVPRMGLHDPVILELYDLAFQNATPPPKLYDRIFAEADHIRAELMAFVQQYDIDLLIPQNSSTIPINIPLGVAFRDLIERTRIPAICHHHDFYWERERFMNNCVQDILDTAFPPQQDCIQHMVINRIMQRRLKTWYGIDAHYMPNVFDFENPHPPPDDYALSFRQEMSLSEDDLIVLQPTRIIRRKAIEKAIELMRKLDDERLILLITGYEGDEPGGYGDWLREEADRAQIRYRFIGDYVKTVRGTVDGKKIFLLWDVYPHAHFITYPSVYEGFGNALIETLYFRKPLIVHTYPMYLSDIKSAGVRAVEFYHDITPNVLAQTRRLIDDVDFRQAMVEHNYAVGSQHFSYTRMREVLQTAISRVSIYST